MCRVCIDHYQGHPVIAPITPREWGEMDASAKPRAAETSVWNSSKSTDSNGCSFWISLQIAMKGYFKRTCKELNYTLLCVRDLINLLSKWYFLHDNQTILRWTAHGLFTDAYCTHKKQELAEIASSDLIGRYYTSSRSLMWGEKSAFKVQGWGRIYFPGCHFWLRIFYMFSFFFSIMSVK